MKLLAQFTFVLWFLLLLGILKLSSFQKTDVSYNLPTSLLGTYCAELGELNLRLKAYATGEKEFLMKGPAGKLVARIKERVIHSDLYLQAPPLNYSESFDNYYSKIRPLAYQKSGAVRVFRYHDMIYDQHDCGESDG